MDKFLRQAAWEIGDKKCFYCREFVPLRNTHLDHVIPAKLFKDNEVTVKEKYNLVNEFDFDSVDNLAISCASCNSSRKRANEYERGIPIWLEEIQKFKEKVLKRCKELEHQLSLDLPDEYKEFFLSFPAFMPTDQSISEIRKKDIPLLRQLSLGEHYYPLHLVSPQDENDKVLIKNLDMFQKYLHKGYYALTTPEIALSSLCASCLTFFDLLESASPLESQTDFEDYWRELPFELLEPTIIGDRLVGHEEHYETLEDYINSKENVEVDVNGKAVEITILHPLHNEEEKYFIKEILQADFTNENNEREAVLFVHYKSAGTLNFSYSTVVTYSSSWKIHHKV